MTHINPLDMVKNRANSTWEKKRTGQKTPQGEFLVVITSRNRGIMLAPMEMVGTFLKPFWARMGPARDRPASSPAVCLRGANGSSRVLRDSRR